MKGIFVTGTDTDVGKTLISALLCKGFSSFFATSYFKPIQCGEPCDEDFIRSLCGKQVMVEPSTYFLKTPASPNRAAQKENIKIDIDQIDKDLQEQQHSAFAVVEGAGGIAVPIDSDSAIIDIVVRSQLPAVVVASTRLGTINHTVLTVRALQQRGVSCLGIVLNGDSDEGLVSVLEEATGVKVLFQVPRWKELNTQVLDHFIKTDADFLGFLDHFASLYHQSLETQLDKWEARDKQVIWHPFTQHGIVKRHPVVKKGKGVSLWYDDQMVIDAISSWWVNLFGHCNPELSAAVSRQSFELEHVIFAGFSHQPAIQLAEKLVEQTNERNCRLQKVFYSDNGSTSVEVALKMAYQYCQQSGQTQRNRFLALKGSYHGDTLGAMSVGEREGFNTVFNPLLFPVDFVDPFELGQLQNVFAENGSKYAAVIVEPMVQGASGMRMYSPEFLNQLAVLAKESNTLVICDEVFTGFYRTGKMFAFEHSNLRPDLLCLSKGLTGGYLPMGATLATQPIFECFNRESLQSAFLHGHSYTANPISCSVACASLDLLKQSRWQNAIADVVQGTTECLHELRSSSKLNNIRQLGTIGAMEIQGKKPNYFKGTFSYNFQQKALKRGVLLRPLGSTVYAVPPYCIEKDELRKIYLTMEQIVNEEL